jgi:hypothetical protein
MIRRLAILATIGLVASAPIVASAQGYGGGGGGYGNPPVDSGFDEMLQYQMMMERQQRLRLQQKKARLSMQNGEAPPTASKDATAAADPKKKKQPRKVAGSKAKSKAGGTKAARSKTAVTPETKTAAKANSLVKAAPAKTATESSKPAR